MRKRKVPKWLLIGATIGVLNALVGLDAVAGRLIGASTGYPFLSGELFGLQQSEYMRQITQAGSWELVFVIGCLLGAVAVSVIRGDFKLTILHASWLRTRGGSVKQRMIYAFVGGFILIFGARLAGGCSSGHVLSGGMQLAVSGLVFGLCAFVAFRIFGRWFYRGGK
ncbi:MAG: YeeE/YedE thiosulfate transporter family protein [Bacillota bacterium]